MVTTFPGSTKRDQKKGCFWRVRPIKRWILSWGIAALLVIMGTQAHGAIYRYVDEEGVVHFSNVPTNPKYKLYLKEEGDRKPPQSYKKPSYYSIESMDYDRIIQEAAKRHGVDSALIKAVIRAESDFDPGAVSQKGAMGLMQLMPGTANDLAVLDAFDPRENIDGGVRYLKELLESFQNDLKLSLAAYNAGRDAVLQYGTIPPYEETRQYVRKVLDFYQSYKK